MTQRRNEWPRCAKRRDCLIRSERIWRKGRGNEKRDRGENESSVMNSNFPRIYTSSFDGNDFMNDVLGGEFESAMSHGPHGEMAEFVGAPEDEWDKEGVKG